jgi:hypothetical protein
MVVIITGCATVFGGAKNKFVVYEGSPPEAEVFLDGQRIGTTPIDKKISKYLLQDGSLVEIKKDGYHTDSIYIERRVHIGYMLLDVIPGLGLGLAIDLATGNIYRPKNSKINYSLKQN